MYTTNLSPEAPENFEVATRDRPRSRDHIRRWYENTTPKKTLKDLSLLPEKYRIRVREGERLWITGDFSPFIKKSNFNWKRALLSISAVLWAHFDLRENKKAERVERALDWLEQHQDFFQSHNNLYAEARQYVITSNNRVFIRKFGHFVYDAYNCKKHIEMIDKVCKVILEKTLGNLKRIKFFELKALVQDGIIDANTLRKHKVMLKSMLLVLAGEQHHIIWTDKTTMMYHRVSNSPFWKSPQLSASKKINKLRKVVLKKERGSFSSSSHYFLPKWILNLYESAKDPLKLKNVLKNLNLFRKALEKFPTFWKQFSKLPKLNINTSGMKEEIVKEPEHRPFKPKTMKEIYAAVFDECRSTVPHSSLNLEEELNNRVLRDLISGLKKYHYSGDYQWAALVSASTDSYCDLLRIYIEESGLGLQICSKKFRQAVKRLKTKLAKPIELPGMTAKAARAYESASEKVIINK
jgi:hypothetical protein